MQWSSNVSLLQLLNDLFPHSSCWTRCKYINQLVIDKCLFSVANKVAHCKSVRQKTTVLGVSIHNCTSSAASRDASSSTTIDGLTIYLMFGRLECNPISVTSFIARWSSTPFKVSLVVVVVRASTLGSKLWRVPSFEKSMRNLSPLKKKIDYIIPQHILEYHILIQWASSTTNIINISLFKTSSSMVLYSTNSQEWYTQVEHLH